MERRYEARLKERWAQAEVPSDLIDGLMGRLEAFVLPFAMFLTEPEQRQNSVEYISGLLSGLDHKTTEAIASLHDQERQGIQKFIGHVPWDHPPLLLTLARQVGADLGEPDGVIVFDPSGAPKKGAKSVGVARQWCGRLGKVENCEAGIFISYLFQIQNVVANVTLYLPEEWAKDRTADRGGGAQGRHVPDASSARSGPTCGRAAARPPRSSRPTG